MVLIKLAYYNKKDWARLMEMISDRESMHDSWHEWHEAFNASIIKFKEQGFGVVKKVMDLDKLEAFCKEHKLENNGAARSKFVNTL